MTARMEAFVAVRRIMFDLELKNEDTERLLIAIIAYGHSCASEVLDELPELRRAEWYLARL